VGAPAPPQGFHQLAYRAAGLRLAVPRSWTTTPENAPLLTVVSSGGAVISLWRYGRPRSVQLQHAYRRLIAAALHRQPKLRVLAATLQAVDGYPAVDLDATEPIGALHERVRSLHVFTPMGEVVLEEYAPPNVFGGVNRQVFEHVSRSLAVLGR
jgi:hypothetical protein